MENPPSIDWEKESIVFEGPLNFDMDPFFKYHLIAEKSIEDYNFDFIKRVMTFQFKQNSIKKNPQIKYSMEAFIENKIIKINKS
jgi:hypothetical protein